MCDFYGNTLKQFNVAGRILAGLLPVHKDARFGKHEVPEVHERLHLVHGCDSVVDQHPSVGYPKGGKYEHHAG